MESMKVVLFCTIVPCTFSRGCIPQIPDGEHLWLSHSLFCHSWWCRKTVSSWI